MANDSQPSSAENAQGDVSLGPACMVVAIFGLVGISIFFVVMSTMLMGKQGQAASRAMREQLIPWVEGSLLDQTDRQVITAKLDELADKSNRDEFTSRQLTRLGFRFTESTILQWGTVEALNRIAQSSGLSPDEKSEFSAACDRWLHAASTGRLNMQDMEFGTQYVCTKERESGRLIPRDDISDENLRDFMRRVTTMCDKFEIPKEEFHKSVSQVFLQVVEEALSEK